MRRTFLKLLAVLPWADSFDRPAGAAPAAASFALLDRPSVPSGKATASAMLSIARAGNRLVAVGERGIVLLSDDGGARWRQAQVPVSVTLTAVQFVNEQRGWAVGHLGVVLHSDDGGEHWRRQLDGMRAAALALQSAQQVPASDAAIRRQAAAQALIDDGPDKPFLDLYFENERTGYVVGAYNLAFRTDDGGRSWRPWMDRIANPKSLHLYGIKPAGDKLYIVGEQGLLLRSADQGQTFARLESPSKGSYFGLLVTSAGELLLYGLRGRAFLSSDGAANWTEVPTGSRVSLSAGVLLADGAVLLASQAGEVLHSRDGGRVFNLVPGHDQLPVTGVVQAHSGRLVATSLRGLREITPPPAAS